MLEGNLESQSGGGGGGSGSSGGGDAGTITGPANNVTQGGSSVTTATDETLWRARALEAEARLAELGQELAQTKQQLDTAARALSALERSRELESAILDAGAIDVETVLVMAEAQALKQPDTSAADLVAEIRQRKPFLFKATPGGAAGSAMSAEPRAATPSGLDQAFGQARTAGDRRSLLKYLRVKRGQ